MNTFVPRLVFDFALVKYYTVEIAGRQLTEFGDFIQRMRSDPRNTRDLGELMAQIRLMGDKYEAHLRYFRDERDIAHRGEAMAIPTKEFSRSRMRLYCHVPSPRVVFLFNGDVKTPGINTAQDCPRVAPHFALANRLSVSINKALEEETILWNADHTALVIDPNTPIQL
ncbi:MAG TPA: hypothetical protein PLR96_10675 [Flavobacteriales bacterium]|nr:hypothetical protein [Flavobacteriales bacterium]